jgi:hypothetical protein
MPLLPFALLLLLAADGPERIARLAHPELGEVSGIVASRRHPGIFWVHNDSGNPPALYAVRRDGSVARRFAVAAPNLDWEDIAIDDSGHLYLGDIGNNGERLPFRAVLRIDEPDPAGEPEGPLRPSWSSTYRFGSGGRFDAEGLAVEGDHLLLVAKRRDGREAELYRLPLGKAGTLTSPAVPEPIGRLPGFREPATGADLSEDGRRLAVCSPASLAVFERAEDQAGGWREVGRVPLEVGQVEAVAWDGEDVILANEPGEVFRVAASAWRGAGR